MTKKTGTREWAEKNINFQIGCENNCRYCYARYNAVDFRKFCPSNSAWAMPVINQKKVDAPHRKKYEGRVMFPSTHDITPGNLSEYLCVLGKLLDAGNNVLIVSKPRWECITIICANYAEYKNQITFRFTIGSGDSKVLAFWEPGAPNFIERLACLKYAHQFGFATSVSCEPYLDAYVGHLYSACVPYINDSFWIGKLRAWESRVKLDGATPEQIARFVEPLKAAQSDSIVRVIHQMLDGQPYIQWKDSIRGVVGR